MVDLLKKYKITQALQHLEKINKSAFDNCNNDKPLEDFFDPTMPEMVRIRNMRNELYLLDHPHYTDAELRDICFEEMRKHEELMVIADRLRISYNRLIYLIKREPKLSAMYKAHYQERGDEVGTN